GALRTDQRLHPSGPLVLLHIPTPPQATGPPTRPSPGGCCSAFWPEPHILEVRIFENRIRRRIGPIHEKWPGSDETVAESGWNFPEQLQDAPLDIHKHFSPGVSVFY